jgi:ferrous iron transport protein B
MVPVFQPLGIDRLLSVALLFGFIAKEIVIGALAVIYGAGQSNLAGVIAGKLDWVQAYSFMLFTLIYTPCLSTVAVLKQESKSWWFTFIAVAWPLGLAWVVSFAFYQGARALGW